MLRIDGGEEHDKFKELCALAASGNLAPLESSEFLAHLRLCEVCQQVFSQYRTITTHGMTALADAYLEGPGPVLWDESAARERLLEGVHAEQEIARERKNQLQSVVRSRWSRLADLRSAIKLAIAAGLIAAVGIGAYSLGVRAQRPAVANLLPASTDNRDQELSAQNVAAQQLLNAQEKKLAQLQEESSQKDRELTKLRLTLQSLENHSNELTAASIQSDAQLRTVTQQRDDLTAKLQALNQSYGNDQAELASLRAERDKSTLQTAALQSKIAELSARTHEQDRRLTDAEQYLSSDRDIRELMGARKLYIADVFDVDGSSRTQRPFGRVFYTQGKSLIFYAFDLDRQPGTVNASTFQVWGQREAPQGESASPTNLGILYMDNESNRRWVMRIDDPKQLAEIDAVFVTVEPRGGSHKPTTKPFLYALLRNEANHP
jgi:hypothetical protein